MLESVRALLENVVDYAGLFPPAALSLADAAASYGQYLDGPNSWMLGRFIIPVARLQELENHIVSNPPARQWKVSVLTGPDLLAAISAVLAFNAHVSGAVIDCLEARAESPDALRSAASGIPNGFTTYFEIPAHADPAPLLAAIAESKCRAKIRTGGIDPTLFPTIEEIALFIRLCDQAKVPFKATAGLHNAVRGPRALTYQPGSATCTMHGFLNVFLASAFLWAGVSDDEVTAILGQEDLPFSWARKGIGWRDRWIGTEQIRSARERLISSFGSCSFEEPVADLHSRELL